MRQALYDELDCMYYTSYKAETRATIKRVQDHLMSCTQSETNRLDREQKVTNMEKAKMAKYFMSPFQKNEDPA